MEKRSCNRNIPHFRQTPIALATALALAENPAAQATPGDFVSEVLPVNRTRAGQQQDPDLAMNADGDVLAAWDNDLTPYDDPATPIDKNIYARRLRGFEKIDLTLKK